jgi:hypothetical protein
LGYRKKVGLSWRRTSRAQPEGCSRNRSANKAAVIFVGLISGAASTVDAEISARST